MNRPKVNVKPVYAQLVHSAVYEGPCRVGTKEQLDPETEKTAGKQAFQRFVEDLQTNLGPDARLLEPTWLEWGDDFVLHESELRKVEPDIFEADLVLMGHPGLTQYPAVSLAERYRKPLGIIGWVATVDITAYLRARGMEGYAFLDYDDLKHFLGLLRARKAIQQTRFLIAAKGNVVPTGVVSSIWDLDGLKQRYGLDYVTITAEEALETMAQLPEARLAEAEQITDTLIANAQKVNMTRENIVPSARFYLAVKDLLAKYESNAFVIPCFEICATRKMEKERVVFCLSHTLLKDQGIPSACEGDVNVLLALAVLMNLSGKSAHMGNSYAVDLKQNILGIHHDVPGLKMKGFDAPELPYELTSFTQAGWGATIRADLSSEVGEPVTLARFNPAGTKLLVTSGELAGQANLDTVGCALSYQVKVRDIVDLFRKEQDFGHHLAMVFGDYLEDLKELGQLMGFEVVEA